MERPAILRKKGYLYLTEFFAGMSVMAVELGASRLLAPYFSSSQIVWTIIIGTIMIAMALGNIYGGRSADKDANPDKLYLRILVASVWIAAIPLVGKYIILAIAGIMVVTINQNFLIIAAFLACMIIFVFPLFLLGTVTPSLAKYTVESLEDSGKVVGTLGAYNTIGSIIGTFLPTFVTIPAVGTAVTFYIFGGILFLLAIMYFISSKRKTGHVIAGMVIFLICMFLGKSNSFAFWEPSLLYEGESVYNYLQVKEDENSVMLSTNVLFGVQSIMMKEDQLTGMYYDYAMAAPLMAGIVGEDAGEMLILGMGTGTYARQCLRYFPNLVAQGVEIDEKITELSRTYFDLPESVSTVNYDGRAYLQGLVGTYDVIMVDAYQDITIPFQMSSVEFFTEVKKHLKENGVMVVNMNMNSGQPGGINDYLSDTIASVFSEVYLVDVYYSSNQILFASMNPDMITDFEDKCLQLPQADLSSMMERVDANMIKYEAGNLLLTDDKAPVELLGMNVIDALIQEELGYYKEAFETNGIEGILGSQ
ncbi:MAG TPA: fused MFS/spermidine synthase [Lachnospiraceae bacterium]|nr:fused MFS/spermidine synthase [Lachnospiraceae bacterium]